MRGAGYHRAAVAKVVDLLPVECPANIVPSTGGGTKVRAGDGCYVVEVEEIFNRSFIIPGYSKADTRGPVTLQDLGCSRIVVPIAYLREHNQFYKPPLSSTGRVTQPAPVDDAVRSSPDVGQPPNRKACPLSSSDPSTCPLSLKPHPSTGVSTVSLFLTSSP